MTSVLSRRSAALLSHLPGAAVMAYGIVSRIILTSSVPIVCGGKLLVSVSLCGLRNLARGDLRPRS